MHADLLSSATPAPQHLKSTNMLERLNEEIRRRTYVLRIFPNALSCLRLVRALAVETNENWMEANRISTWTTCASTRSSLYAKPHDQHHGRPFLQNLTHTTPGHGSGRADKQA